MTHPSSWYVKSSTLIIELRQNLNGINVSSFSTHDRWHNHTHTSGFMLVSTLILLHAIHNTNVQLTTHC
jgi:hypothetical protein